MADNRKYVPKTQRSAISRRPGLSVRQSRGRCLAYPAPTQPLTLNSIHQHPSVVRYFKSLSEDDQWTTNVVHSEPDCARDVEVLVVHRQASYQDIVRSRDKTYRKLLDLFDWDAMKVPIEEQPSQEARMAEESSSDEETDSADEIAQHQETRVIAYPRTTVIRFEEHPSDRLNALEPVMAKPPLKTGRGRDATGRGSARGHSSRSGAKGEGRFKNQ
ncbi:AAEL009973-PA [Aedes aegypti]|uniref:AAEL009973-PA n=1 Tax=Aedes aegypti TaxID=7159 RepID=Q16UB4_AEDAE|nr:AAEL009973-PA [Aedes aegypti]